MLKLPELPKPAQLLAIEEKYSAEEWLEFSILWKPLIVLQELPDIALRIESGMYIPPHQRTMLHVANLGVSTNIFPCSRGTAKTSTIGTLYATHQNVHNPRRNWVTLSATGFRGGQRIFEETEAWMNGDWDSQNLDKPWLYSNTKRERQRDRPASRGAGKWRIVFESTSTNSTMQTQDAEGIRGERGKVLLLDEANLTTDEFVEKIVKPFLNVKGNMRQGGQFAEDNQLFMLSTVDFNWRSFAKRIEAAKAGLEHDLDLYLSLQRGDMERYRRLHDMGFAEYNLVQFDYTDVLIRKYITTRDGQQFEVNYTDKVIPLKRDLKGIPYMFPNEEGRLVKDYSPPVEYWPTYSVDKASLEKGLYDGTATEAIWLYEQRNIMDNASGDVYLNSLVDMAECKGETYIVPWSKLPEAWQERYPKGTGYSGPCLYRCTDPCVLGVDYAPEHDFCSFVVIRVGPLANGVFDPFSHTGKTTWSNVIWCEQWDKMDFRQMGQKIWDMQQRYNLVYFTDVSEEGHCRAIGLDNRGGGHGVRDMLAGIGAELPKGQPRIYDPTDADERVQAFRDDKTALPMLDNIKSSDVLNMALVDFTIAQMQQKFLYIPKWVDKTERTTGPETHISYDAARKLSEQLRKLRQKPTKNARTFYMDGDTNDHRNKKDLWAAFIYAGKQLRAHLIRLAQLNSAPPPMSAKKVVAGSQRGKRYGKAAGAKGWR